jgi:hypothetical protein
LPSVSLAHSKNDTDAFGTFWLSQVLASGPRSSRAEVSRLFLRSKAAATFSFASFAACSSIADKRACRIGSSGSPHRSSTTTGLRYESAIRTSASTLDKSESYAAPPLRATSVGDTPSTLYLPNHLAFTSSGSGAPAASRPVEFSSPIHEVCRCVRAIPTQRRRPLRPGPTQQRLG